LLLNKLTRKPNQREEEIEPNCSGEGTRPNHRENERELNHR